MKNKNTMFLVQAAAIGAIYVVLTLLFAPLSYGEVQVRFGCIIANLFGGAIPADIIFGSIATLLGALGTYALRKKSRFLAPLPPIIANTLIVPFVLYYGYGVNLPIPFMMLTVGIGEVLSCGVIGLVLQSALKNYSHVIFRDTAKA